MAGPAVNVTGVFGREWMSHASAPTATRLGPFPRSARGAIGESDGVWTNGDRSTTVRRAATGRAEGHAEAKDIGTTEAQMMLAASVSVTVMAIASFAIGFACGKYAGRQNAERTARKWSAA
jgi:hypothetical protein